MFKRFIFIVLGLLFSFLLLFTVYRASVNLGPLNLSSIFSLMGNSFSRTSDHLQLIFAQFQTAVNGLLTVSRSPIYEVTEAENFGNAILALSKLLFSSVGYAFTWLNVLLFRLLKLVIILIQDVSDIIRILGFFVIGYSPYPVVPYFPVGG